MKLTAATVEINQQVSILWMQQLLGLPVGPDPSSLESFVTGYVIKIEGDVVVLSDPVKGTVQVDTSLDEQWLVSAADARDAMRDHRNRPTDQALAKQRALSLI